MTETPSKESMPEDESMPGPTMEDSTTESSERPMSDAMSDAGPMSGEPESKAPSRLGRFAWRALRWVTAVIVIFGLGFGATWLVRVRPLMTEVTDLRQQLLDSDKRLSDAEQRLSQLEGVQARNQELQDSLIEAQAHLDLLAVLVDVTTAQLAIAQEDTAQAQLTLAGVSAKLDALDSQEIVPLDQVQGLRERLALVIEELNTDVFATQRDLEILSNTLVAMERDLFGTGN